MQDRTKEFEKLAEEMSEEDSQVLKSQMFGMPCLKINSKAFAGLFNGEMVFKLTGEAHAKALASAGAKLFDPMGGGRAMKEWVQVPFTSLTSWRAAAEDAKNYVESSAKKESVAKKKPLAKVKPSAGKK